MQNQFVKTINNHRFGFTRVEEPELAYQVDFLHKGSLRVFRMTRSADGHWNIENANMPAPVFESIDELERAIKENEKK